MRGLSPEQIVGGQSPHENNHIKRLRKELDLNNLDVINLISPCTNLPVTIIVNITWIRKKPKSRYDLGC